MSLDAPNVIISIIVESDWICKCGHRRDKHAPEGEVVDTAPCYECLGLYLHDRNLKTSLVNVHRICGDFKLDNLRWLEQLYEKLSKRI